MSNNKSACGITFTLDLTNFSTTEVAEYNYGNMPNLVTVAN